jgi:class 3 adenylate cyclase
MSGDTEGHHQRSGQPQSTSVFLAPRRRAGRHPRLLHEAGRPREHAPTPPTAANLPTHRTIVVVDVVSFTRPDRDNTDQLAIREAMYDTLRAAFDDSGVPWRQCLHEDRGDGVLIFVPAEVSKVLLLGAAPARLAELLEAGNAGRPPRRRFRLRMVVHAGEVHRDPHGFAGHDVNLAFRLVDAGPLRAAMDDHQAALGLIVSDSVYQGVVRHRYDGLDPHAYQRVRVQVKTADAPGWIRLVGADAPAPAATASGEGRGTIAVLLSEDAASLEDLRRLGIEAVVLVRGPEDLASIARLPIYIEGELIE